MELIQQLKNWEKQVSGADEGAAADMDVAKRLLTHGMDALDEIRRLEIALRIKTEEHQCCSEDLIELRKSEQEGWKEAAIAWDVCASIHETWAKKKDALYSTRHADFERHAEDARRKLTHNAIGQRGAACGASAAPTGCASNVEAEKEE